MRLPSRRSSLPAAGAQRPSHGATVREVAEHAGVSVATVSRVLSGKGPAQESTWQRVLRSAEALHYVPHGGARSLSTRTTNTVGVLLPDLYGEFFSEVIRGIDLTARANGYHLLVSGSHSDRSEMAAVLVAMRGRVDGLIVMSPAVEAAALSSNIPSAGVPVVLLNSRLESGHAITIDNHGGAVQVIEHLIALGHRSIAFLQGPSDNADACERLRGYREAMLHAGLKPGSDLEIAGDFSEEAGYAAAKTLLARPSVPTALFAANDAMAIGALSALHECGVKVPEEMALVGFDDIPIARFVTPSLTTVSVAIAEFGRRALEMLLHVMNKEIDHGDQREILPATLVVRQSCGARLTKPEMTATS